MNDVNDEAVDHSALERIWPLLPYGKGGWWTYVGRTRQQRDGLKALRVKAGPRGFIVLSGRNIRTRSTFAGEFEARTLRDTQPAEGK